MKTKNLFFKPISQEMNPATRETEKISYVFFSPVHTKKEPKRKAEKSAKRSEDPPSPVKNN
jgi:hypothetical protein